MELLSSGESQIRGGEEMEGTYLGIAISSEVRQMSRRRGEALWTQDPQVMRSKMSIALFFIDLVSGKHKRHLSSSTYVPVERE